MKRILITGAGSYIGQSFEAYLRQWPDQYQVDTLDLLDKNWKNADFSGFHAIFHVAGIAHIRETAENAHLYYEVNRDLAVDVAQKAKQAHVAQFVFLSSMSVYGVEEGVITPKTSPAPKSNYGKSKLQAEEKLCQLREDGFSVTVLRPPMVYGDGCKGNYQMLVKLAACVPVFPSYKNQRSMIHIDRLCMFVKGYIDHQNDGLFFPQDEAYVCTTEMVKQIGADMGRTILLLSLLNPIVWIAKACTTKGKKAFGDLIYTRED